MSSGMLATLRTENAIRWALSATADANGQPVWGSPSAATCSPWTAAQKLVLSAQGQDQQATARAFVSAAVAQGDKLALGTFSGATPSTPTSDALEVLSVEEATTPLDGELVRVAYLGG
jgi:hypothetical protein